MWIKAKTYFISAIEIERHEAVICASDKKWIHNSTTITTKIISELQITSQINGQTRYTTCSAFGAFGWNRVRRSQGTSAKHNWSFWREQTLTSLFFEILSLKIHTHLPLYNHRRFSRCQKILAAHLKSSWSVIRLRRFVFLISLLTNSCVLLKIDCSVLF